MPASERSASFKFSSRWGVWGRGFSGPCLSGAFLNGVGVWGVLSMEHFWSGVTNAVRLWCSGVLSRGSGVVTTTSGCTRAWTSARGSPAHVSRLFQKFKHWEGERGRVLTGMLFGVRLWQESRKDRLALFSVTGTGRHASSSAT